MNQGLFGEPESSTLESVEEDNLVLSHLNLPTEEERRTLKNRILN